MSEQGVKYSLLPKYRVKYPMMSKQSKILIDGKTESKEHFVPSYILHHFVIGVW